MQKKQLLWIKLTLMSLISLFVINCNNDNDSLDMNNTEKIENKTEIIFTKVIYNPIKYGFKLDSINTLNKYYSKLDERLIIPNKFETLSKSNNPNRDYGLYIIKSENYNGWFGYSRCYGYSSSICSTTEGLLYCNDVTYYSSTEGMVVKPMGSGTAYDFENYVDETPVNDIRRYTP